MKRNRISSALVLMISIVPLLAYGVSYPKPIGYVNDFANVLTPDSKRTLESALRDYKDKTSIEIAVVTVPSLEGMSVEDYTIGLARLWGVGDRKKNNGVVLLVAPNERKVRIEVGYGLEPDLTDSQAGQIIQSLIIPFFKEKKMSEGIVAGVGAVLQELGEKPFESRLEERKLAEEKRKLEAEKRDAELKNFLMMAGIFLASVAVATLLGWLIYLPVKKRKARERAEKEGKELLKTLPKEIEKAEEMVSNKDVTDRTKRLLQNAKAQYESGKKIAGDSPVDWILVFAAFTASYALLKDAIRYVSYDKSSAEEARRPRPKPVPASSRRSSQSSAPSRRSDDSGYSPSVWSSGSSSSSSGSGGSSFDFGSFSGGSFGGGGASGSW